jgi:hypothetical protein
LLIFENKGFIMFDDFSLAAENSTTLFLADRERIHPTIPPSIVVGNKSALPVTSVGNTIHPGPFYLNNVLVTPDIIKNLLFVHQFTTDN